MFFSVLIINYNQNLFQGYELQRFQFHQRMKKLRVKHLRARQWLDNIPLKAWAQSDDEGRQYGYDYQLDGGREFRYERDVSFAITSMFTLTFW